MKKIIIFLFVLTLISILVNNKKQVIIPNTAIRFRIIANSNTEKDQTLKYKLKDEIEPGIVKTLEQSQTINEARTNIKNYLPVIEKQINNYTNDYEINYGDNYFPEKEFKGVLYPEGNYESLVITLGNGLGDNWWCVLFPPLCLLEAEESDLKNTEYKFYVQEIIQKFKN